VVGRKVIDFILAGDIHTAHVILPLGCDLGDGCSFTILGPRNLDGGNEICLASLGCFFGLCMSWHVFCLLKFFSFYYIFFRISPRPRRSSSFFCMPIFSLEFILSIFQFILVCLVLPRSGDLDWRFGGYGFMEILFRLATCVHWPRFDDENMS
jgi:hypothetical protein